MEENTGLDTVALLRGCALCAKNENYASCHGCYIPEILRDPAGKPAAQDGTDIPAGHPAHAGTEWRAGNPEDGNVRTLSRKAMGHSQGKQ